MPAASESRWKALYVLFWAEWENSFYVYCEAISAARDRLRPREKDDSGRAVSNPARCLSPLRVLRSLRAYIGSMWDKSGRQTAAWAKSGVCTRQGAGSGFCAPDK